MKPTAEQIKEIVTRHCVATPNQVRAAIEEALTLVSPDNIYEKIYEKIPSHMFCGAERIEVVHVLKRRGRPNMDAIDFIRVQYEDGLQEEMPLSHLGLFYPKDL
jgi:hypothetical protein